MPEGYMTLEEFTQLVKDIQATNSFARAKGKCIKYITPVFDTRINQIFCINLRRSGDGLDFSTTNENKTKDLNKWIRAWLDEGTWNSTEVQSNVEA